MSQPYEVRPTAQPEPTPAGIVDLFAGIGCVAQGFARTGFFEPIAFVDIDPDAAETSRNALGDIDYLERDIARLQARDLLESADGREISGIVGCPPCQGFSAAGLRRSDDVRNALLNSYFDVIARHRPKFFVMENVPSVLYRPELHRLLAGKAADYVTAGTVVNAACYGVPQTRQRTLLIGYRRDLEIVPTLPTPTHWGRAPIFHYGAQELRTPELKRWKDVLGDSPHIGVSHDERRDMRALLPDDPSGLHDFVVVEDAIGDLPGPGSKPVETDRTPSAYALQLASALPTADERVANHTAWNHSAQMRSRMRKTPEGGRPASGRRYHSQAYARLHRRGIARTVTTNFHNPGSGRFTHPSAARTLTVREAARLQGIPDGVEFFGTQSTQERLVGNAFPPPLAEAIARHVAGELGDLLSGG